MVGYNEIAGLRVRPAVATYATVCAQSKGLRAGRSYSRMVLIFTLIACVLVSLVKSAHKAGVRFPEIKPVLQVNIGKNNRNVMR